MRKAAEPMNLGSNKQLAELIYDAWSLHRHLGLRHPPQTKKRNPATDADTMEKLAPYSPFCQELMKFRLVSKLVNTYTAKLPDMVSRRTGRIHASFRQTGAGTGRFTCSDPNLQNIPNRTEEGRRLREAFIPEDGWVLLAPDYSQIELRVCAHLSGEECWIEAFRAGQDIHQATADLVGVDRAVAKTVNFGSLYGAGPTRIANEAKVSVDQAQAWLESYWAGLPKVRAFLDRCIEEARETGVIWTMDRFRRRHLPDIHHRWSGLRKTAENAAGNTPVQGTAADIIKRAMVAVHHTVLPDFRAAMIGQVHDELIFEVRHEEAEAMGARLKETMEGVVTLDVPLLVEVSGGKTWAEAH
jgi:DNA polymerase-1